MDLQRLEQWVLRCPLQELTWQDDSGVYTLGNLHTRPVWWYVRYEVGGKAFQHLDERRGLQAMIGLIAQVYPSFSAWLLLTFPA